MWTRGAVAHTLCMGLALYTPPLAPSPGPEQAVARPLGLTVTDTVVARGAVGTVTTLRWVVVRVLEGRGWQVRTRTMWMKPPGRH
jgi:hypothetical protein